MPSDNRLLIHQKKPRLLDLYCGAGGCSEGYRRAGFHVGGVGGGYPNLIPQTRELLEATGLPYMIENVEGFRRELRNPVRLCGTGFGLDVQRHRALRDEFPADGDGGYLMAALKQEIAA